MTVRLQGAPTCNAPGAMQSAGTFNAANFSRIFRGDTAVTDDDACPALGGGPAAGHVPFLSRAAAATTSSSRYTATGLGYQTRPGGPVPTITVSLQNVTFQFFFLGGLLGFNNIDHALHAQHGHGRRPEEHFP